MSKQTMIRLSKEAQLELVDGRVQSGEIHSTLRRTFGPVHGDILFEMIGLGQENTEKLNWDFVEGYEEPIS